jgi:hypothetical protein
MSLREALIPACPDKVAVEGGRGQAIGHARERPHVGGVAADALVHIHIVEHNPPEPRRPLRLHPPAASSKHARARQPPLSYPPGRILGLLHSP